MKLALFFSFVVILATLFATADRIKLKENKFYYCRHNWLTKQRPTLLQLTNEDSSVYSVYKISTTRFPQRLSSSLRICYMIIFHDTLKVDVGKYSAMLFDDKKKSLTKNPLKIKINLVLAKIPKTLLATVKEFALNNTETPEIPKIIWAYWDSHKIPKVVQKCFDNWKRFNPGYEIIVVTSDKLADLDLPPYPSNFDELDNKGQSDWLRVALMYTYGGFWIDGSTILTKSLDWIRKEQQEKQNEGLMYYIAKSTVDMNFPIIENWFLASIPGTPFMKAWLDGFTDILNRFGNLGDGRFNELRQMYGEETASLIRQNIDSPNYLKQHIEAQKIMRIDGIKPNVSFLKAEDGPFFYIAKRNWNAYAMIYDLTAKRVKGNVPPLIKLLGWHRDLLTVNLFLKVFIRSDSIVGKYLLGVSKPKRSFLRF